MKTYVKRIMALALTFALVFAIPFAFTQEASAASSKAKKQIVYLRTQRTFTFTREDGNTDKTVTKAKYNKKGFITQMNTKDGKDTFKTVIKYNKKGYIKSVKEYSKGKLAYQIKVKMNKNGMPKQAKAYSVKKKKKTLNVVRTYYYDGKKLVKVKYYYPQEKVTETTPVTNAASDTSAETDSDYTAKYDSNGRLIEEKWSGTNTGDPDEKGVTETVSYESIWSYTYDDAGNRTKEDIRYSSVTTFSDGSPSVKSSSHDIFAYKYKKFKVAKNFNSINFINSYISDYSM